MSDDTNGDKGIMIRKPTIMLIAVLLSVVIALSSVVAYTTEIKSDVDHNKDILNEVEPKVSQNREDVLVVHKDIQSLNEKLERVEEKVDKLLKGCSSCQSS